MEFVNWDPAKGRFVNEGYNKTREQVEALANTKRPEPIEKLVDALTRMWGRLGVHKLCGDCFAGKLGYPVEAHGCCHSCAMLGPNKCNAKPMGCAIYMCGYVAKLLHENNTLQKVEALRTKLFSKRLPWSVYSTGYEMETKYEYTEEQLTNVVALTTEVDGILAENQQ